MCGFFPKQENKIFLYFRHSESANFLKVSPLILKDLFLNFQAGANSFGLDSCRTDKGPDHFMNVSYYMEFIHAAVEEAPCTEQRLA